MSNIAYLYNQPFNFNQYELKTISEKELSQAINKVKREQLRLKDNMLWSDFCVKESTSCQLAVKNEHINNIETNITSIQPVIKEKKVNDLLTILSDVTDDENTIKKSSYHDEMLKYKNNKRLVISNVLNMSLPNEVIKMKNEAKLKMLEEQLCSNLIKIRQILDNIRSRVYDFRIPDTPTDIVQIQKKAIDFQVRFSRNYFYQIELQFTRLMDLKENIAETSSFTFKRQKLLPKISKDYQTLYQAYIMFHRHMHVIWGYNGVASKLNDLVNFTIKFNNSCKEFCDEKHKIHYNELNIVCHSVIESVKNLINIKHPLAYLEKTKSKKMFPLTNHPKLQRSKSENKLNKLNSIQSSKNNITKRNVHSATTYDQFYMYRDKQAKVNKFYPSCKHRMCGSYEKEKVCRKEESNKHIKISASDGSRQSAYHKNCFNRFTHQFKTVRKEKSTENKVPKIKEIDLLINQAPSLEVKHFNTPNSMSNNNDVPLLTEILEQLYKDDEENSKKNLPSNAEIKEDENNKNNNIITIVHDNLEKNIHENNSKETYYSNRDESINDETLKNKLSLSKYTLPQKSTIYDSISEKFITDELSNISDDMKKINLPLEQFIKHEVEHFSKFLHKARLFKS